MKRYRIGEVARMLGLKPYTLKHYEEKGLVMPLVDDESGYRYYTYREIGQLIMVRNLRAAGLSIAEVHGVLKESPKDTADFIASQHKHNLDRIAQMERQNRILEIKESSIRRAMNRRGTWEIVSNASELAFLPHFLGDTIDHEAFEAMKSASWKAAMEHAELGFLVSPSESKTQAEWGLVLYPGSPLPDAIAHLVHTVSAGRRLDVFDECDRESCVSDMSAACARAIDVSGVSVSADEALCVVNNVCVSETDKQMLCTLSVPIR